MGPIVFNLAVLVPVCSSRGIVVSTFEVFELMRLGSFSSSC